MNANTEASVNAGFLLSLVGAVFIGPMALAIFMPALPQIRAEFGVDLQYVQLSLTLPLVAILITPLLVGRQVDHIGRRPVMLLSLGLVIPGCLLCIYASEYWMLVVGRVIVGVSSSACLIVGRVIVFDVYEGPRLSQAMARFTIPPVIAILLSPIIGGVLIDASGWRPIFWLILFISTVLMIVTWVCLPETSRRVTMKKDQELKLRALFHSRSLWSYVVQSSFHFAIAFSFASIAPHIMVQRLGHTFTEYSFGLLAVMVALLSGIVLAERISSMFSIPAVVFNASLLGILVSVVCTVPMIYIPLQLTVYTLFVPALLVAFSIGLAMPSAQAGIVTSVEGQAGTTSGISTASQMLMAAVFVHLAAIPWEDVHIYIGFLSILATGVAWMASGIALAEGRKLRVGEGLS